MADEEDGRHAAAPEDGEGWQGEEGLLTPAMADPLAFVLMIAGLLVGILGIWLVEKA